MTDSKAVAVAAPLSTANVSVFQSESSFAMAQRMARALTSSMLVPTAYQGDANLGNALIAMDMANRMGLSPMTVMQNLHVISGRPSWSSTFIISALAQSGMFSPLRWKVTDLGEREVSFEEWQGPKGSRTKVTKKTKLRDMQFVAYAIEKSTGEVLEGPPVSYGMAVKEGWFFKPDSKWQTMPELMGRYRAAAFFGRLYAPHILNGMQTQEEVIDVEYEVLREAPTGTLEAETRPEGRARGLHAAMGNGAAETTPEPAKPAAKPRKAKEPTGKPAEAKDHSEGSRLTETGRTAGNAEPETQEEDAVDAEFEENGDDEELFGPDDGENGGGDDDEFSPA